MFVGDGGGMYGERREDIGVAAHRIPSRSSTA